MARNHAAAWLQALLVLLCTGHAIAEDSAAIAVDDNSFKCLAQMTKVRHFYVDNLLGNVDATVAVAKSETGGVYPPGSVLQLFAGEVMIKHRPGYNAATRDWEFFELDVSPEGSKIRKRGFADVNNRFGGNCFACHAAAKPEFDLVCEQDHGCAPIPVTRAMFGALQKTDPRCQPPVELTEDDKKSLAELDQIIKAIMEQNNK
jgi:hypothetical protein